MFQVRHSTTLLLSQQKRPKQYYCLLVDWIKKAHENRVVLGDRWPGNTIWDGEALSLIDFDLSYEGTFERARFF